MITAIERATSEATLPGPHANAIVMKLRDRSKLDRVGVGDLVDITYTETRAVAGGGR